MAQRRMFSKQITNSSEFLMMSPSAQNLYFHFGMNADDDGFCEVFTIMRMTESKPDDLQALHARGLIYVVDSKICIVKDWHENNQIRLDRYKQSVYLNDPKYVDIYSTIMDEKIKKIDVYKGILDGLPNGNQMAPQVRLGKDRIGKNTNTDTEDKKPIKKKYGEMQSVLLTDEEVTKLIERIGEQPLKALIFELDTYIQSKGAKYKSHYATLLNWANRKSKEITKTKGRGLAQ